MTTNILNLTRIENQGILTGQASFNLSEQIRKCILLLEKKWAKKSLQLDVDFEEYEVVANEDMLKQVWFNLLDNAIKFSDPKTDLKIMVEKVENNLAVSVSNHGVTIKEEDYSKIFTKFYRADKLGKDGNGIGLSIVKHIVELHKGDISVESKSGLTTFTVLLPCEEGNIA